ncbi:MAG: MFS transporter [Candidatus Aenigmatarchaeota archaeon]
MDNMLGSNIWKYYLSTALMQFTFFVPVIQLFYLDNGLTIFNIALLGVIWSLTRLVVEVPSSILADKWGRKKVLIIASAFGILQLAVLILASEYWHFVLASAFSAVAFAFMSGTNTAFFYDTLKELKREREFEKLRSRQLIYEQIPLVIAFLASGFLFQYSQLLPFQLSLAFLVASLAVTMSFREPRYHKPIKQSIFGHFHSSMKHVVGNNQLKAVLIFSVLFSVGSDISYNYGQVYLNYLAMPVVLFGIAYTLKSLLVTASGNLLPALRKHISYRDIFAFQILAAAALLYVMVFTGNYIIGAVCFVLFAIPHGLFVISRSGYVHQRTKSSNRATVESIFSSMAAVTFLFVELMTGYLGDLYTIKTPFLVIAIVLSVYFVYYLAAERRKI